MVGDEMTLAQAQVRGFELLRLHTGRLIDYVKTQPSAELDRRVPGLTWSAREVIMHLQSVYERYTVDSRRAPTPVGVAEQNADDLARLGGDVQAAVKSIDAQVGTIAPLVDTIQPEALFPFHSGQQTTLAGGWGNLLGELLAHGDDLARATGRPFRLPGADLEITWRFTVPLLQGWLRPETAGLEESWLLRFPFGDIWLVLDRGSLRTEAATSAPNRTITVPDVEAFTLTFPYRRGALTDPTTALLASRFYDL
jgi:hypothetical protein